jgi:hypothetical protein
MSVTRADLIEYGTDTSGRPILMTDRMLTAWWCVLTHPRVTPFADRVVIVQGAWQALLGGGAAASAGYHDGGGALDLRSSNLTRGEIDSLVWAMRSLGWAATWRRDQLHGGFDPHIHGVYGGDVGIAFGAMTQIASVFAGGDGLVGGGRDYEDRPNPMPKKLPEEARMGVLQDIGRAVWDTELLVSGEQVRAGRVLAGISNDSDKLAEAMVKFDPSLDPAKIKAAVKAAFVEIGNQP